MMGGFDDDDDDDDAGDDGDGWYDWRFGKGLI